MKKTIIIAASAAVAVIAAAVMWFTIVQEWIAWRILCDREVNAVLERYEGRAGDNTWISIGYELVSMQYNYGGEYQHRFVYREIRAGESVSVSYYIVCFNRLKYEDALVLH